jgi:ribosomal protein S18 acetylase RimI-like enzyme
MEIRPLQPANAKIIRKLRLEALLDSPESFGSSYEEEREYPLKRFKDRLESGCTLGAFLHEELVGMVTLMEETRNKTRHKATIYAMYVRPAQRGQGIGKKLMIEAIKQAKRINGIEQIHLSVVTSNDAAKQLYLSLGFEIYGRERHALKIGDSYLDEEHMCLFL